MFITFLWVGIMFAFFHSLGNGSISRQFLKIRCNGFDIEDAQSFIMRIEISSWPWSLFWPNDLIILTISSAQNSKDESLSLVSKFVIAGIVLSLDIGVHCLAKKLLNRFALSKKLVTSLLVTSSGDISGILLPFTNVLKMVQYVFEDVFGSLSLLARRSWYFDLEELIAFNISSVRAFKDAWSMLPDFLCLWYRDFFLWIKDLISSFIQGESLSSHKINLFGM